MYIQFQNIIKAQTGKISLGIIMIEQLVTGSTGNAGCHQHQHDSHAPDPDQETKRPTGTEL